MFSTVASSALNDRLLAEVASSAALRDPTPLIYGTLAALTFVCLVAAQLATKTSVRAFALPLLFGMLVIGCAGDGSALIANSEEYLDSLPDYPEPEPAYDRALDGAEFEYGSDQVCSSTTYEINDAPAEVVMFNTDPQVFWPGALIQGDSYESGSPLLLPLANRAPLDLSIQGLYADQSAAFDVRPTQSEVNQAVQALLAEAVHSGTPSTQGVFFNQKEAYSFEQAALKLGFSARYLGARVKGSLSYKTNSEQNTIVANATIRTFTVSVDQPPSPSAFFEGLSAEELDEQVELGRLSEENLPVYVASVTYGQIMMFSASSSSSMRDLRGALAASFSSFAGGAAASLSEAQQKLLQESEITVVTLGGSEQGVANLIREGKPAEFFTGTTVVTSSVPIGYTLKDLHGNVVKVGESSQYDLTTCQPNGFANFYVTNEGGRQGDGSVTAYYVDGSESELAEPIEALHAPQSIAYDSLNDSIQVLSSHDGVPHVGIYEANGVPSEEPRYRVNGGTRGIAYDSNHARIYAVGNLSSELIGRVMEAYNPNGEPLRIQFWTEAGSPGYPVAYAAAYDTKRNRIYVTIEPIVSCAPPGPDCGAPSEVVAFDFQGAEIELEGSFEGLGSPRGIAYDPHLDRIYVSDRSTDEVKVFDAEGNSIELPTPIENLSGPQGLHFDTTHNRLYVVNHDSSVITAYEPDGTPAQGLALPAFPNLNRPTSIAYRPF